MAPEDVCLMAEGGETPVTVHPGATGHLLCQEAPDVPASSSPGRACLPQSDGGGLGLASTQFRSLH